MRSKLKVFILIAVFVVPGAVFVFLKMFGTNSFSIPVIEETIPCKIQGNEILLVNNQTEAPKDMQEDINQLRRVLERYNNTSGLKLLVNSNDSSKFELTGKYNMSYQLDNTMGECLSRYAGNGSKILLFDEQRRLRGTYNVDRAEIDRLFMEVDILKLGKEDITRR